MNTAEFEILLAEDNASDAELVLHALRKNTLIHRIHVVRDGEEALNFLFCTDPDRERARRALPQLILLDLKLPKVDGLSVLRALKQDRRTRGIPVIVLTSSREDKDLIASYDLGVNSYVQKPVDFDQFHAALETLAHYWLTLNQPPPPYIPSDSAEEPA